MTNPNIIYLMLTQTTNLFTLGKLYQCQKGKPDKFLFYTLECPWKNNSPFISCIPAGDYLIKPCVSEKYGKSYFLESSLDGVVGYDDGIRTHCLFHRANIASELSGCIAIGNSMGNIADEVAVLSSASAINRFLSLLDGYDYRLKILRR